MHDAIQQEFDQGEIADDDFTSTRSRLDREARELVEERDVPPLPPCGP